MVLIILSIFLIKCHLEASSTRVVHARGPAPRVLSLQTETEELSGVEKFFHTLGKVLRDQDDQKQVSNILKEYQQNRKDPNAWEDAQIKLQLSSISPDKKVEVQNFLNAIR